VTEDLKYPDPDAAFSVLEKIGVDPNSRDLHCQDFEYTTGKMEELDKYLEVYKRTDTTVYEKRLLGCYFMEGLNDYVSVNDVNHPLQNQIFEILHRDFDLHHRELEYRVETDDPNEDHWWPIRKYVIAWRAETEKGT